jgi:soluble lytic murein transglycosylase-like protein
VVVPVAAAAIRAASGAARGARAVGVGGRKVAVGGKRAVGAGARATRAVGKPGARAVGRAPRQIRRAAAGRGPGTGAPGSRRPDPVQQLTKATRSGRSGRPSPARGGRRGVVGRGVNVARRGARLADAGLTPAKRAMGMTGRGVGAAGLMGGGIRRRLGDAQGGRAAGTGAQFAAVAAGTGLWAAWRSGRVAVKAARFAARRIPGRRGLKLTLILVVLLGLLVVTTSAAYKRQGDADQRTRAELAAGVAAVGAAWEESQSRGCGSSREQGQVGDDIRFAEVFNRTAELGVDPRLVAAVAAQESGFDPDAVLQASAAGIMQFVEGTARSWGLRADDSLLTPAFREDPDPRLDERFDPAKAIPAGARLLASLHDEFAGADDYWVYDEEGWDPAWQLALAGYNAGSGAVRSRRGIPPFPETRNYVRAIMQGWERYREEYPAGELADEGGTSADSDSAGCGVVTGNADRQAIVARARIWTEDENVPYSQSAFYPRPGDFPQGTLGWRQDCSGFVSMTWQLDVNATTVTLDSTYAVPIERDELLAGDVILKPQSGSAGHVVLFERWDEDPDYYWGYEQTAGEGTTVHRRIPYPYFHPTGYSPYRSRALA